MAHLLYLDQLVVLCLTLVLVLLEGCNIIEVGKQSNCSNAVVSDILNGYLYCGGVAIMCPVSLGVFFFQCD